jgi:thymidine phosphorylase
MLVLGGAAADLDEGERMAIAALDDGRAARKFREIIEAQGGNPAVVDDPGILPQASSQLVLTAERAGYIEEMDVRAIGTAAVELGAGRRSLGATIDPAVGFYVTKKTGDAVAKDEPWATIHASTDAAAERAAIALRNAVRFGETRGIALPLIVERLSAGDADA